MLVHKYLYDKLKKYIYDIYICVSMFLGLGIIVYSVQFNNLILEILGLLLMFNWLIDIIGYRVIYIYIKFDYIKWKREKEYEKEN